MAEESILDAFDRMMQRIWDTGHAELDHPYRPIVVSEAEATYIEQHGGWSAVYDRAMSQIMQQQQGGTDDDDPEE